MILVIAWMKASGASTNALASASGGNEHLSSIFFDGAGVPACICSRIAAALFSQRFRSSSIALCASDPVCGGTVRSAGGVPQRQEECTLRQCGSWDGCNGHYCSADVIVLHLIGGGCLCDS